MAIGWGSIQVAPDSVLVRNVPTLRLRGSRLFGYKN